MELTAFVLFFLAIILLLNVFVVFPIIRYLTGYSWLTSMLLLVVITAISSLVGPILSPHFEHSQKDALDTLLKLYVESVLIKTFLDTALLQFFSTIIVTRPSPPLMDTFKLLLAANGGIMIIVVWLYANF